MCCVRHGGLRAPLRVHPLALLGAAGERAPTPTDRSGGARAPLAGLRRLRAPAQVELAQPPHSEAQVSAHPAPASLTATERALLSHRAARTGSPRLMSREIPGTPGVRGARTGDERRCYAESRIDL